MNSRQVELNKVQTNKLIIPKNLHNITHVSLLQQFHQVYLKQKQIFMKIREVKRELFAINIKKYNNSIEASCTIIVNGV